MAQGCSDYHDVDTGRGLQWSCVGEPLERSYSHRLRMCVQRFCVLVTDRHPGAYVGTRTADCAMLAWGLKFALNDWFEEKGDFCAPVSASKKKALPNPTHLITMHAESVRHDVRESFRAEIVVPIKRNALHLETVCALLDCGKGVDALAV